MPNVKLFVDDRVLSGLEDRLEAILLELRGFLCPTFGVAETLCHLVIVPVRSFATQTPVSIELSILMRTDRPRERIEAACAELQLLAQRLLGVAVAIRCSALEAESYVVKR